MAMEFEDVADSSGSIVHHLFYELPPFPLMPDLTTLIFDFDDPRTFRHPDPDVRVSFLRCLTHYLCHSTPALHYLILPLHEWINAALEPLLMLQDLTELKGVDLGSCQWLQEGDLRRYWKEKEGKGVRLPREEAEEGLSLWGEEIWPSVREPWRGSVDREQMLRVDLMTTRATKEEDVVLSERYEGMVHFKDEVDEVAGSVAFFDAIWSRVAPVFTAVPRVHREPQREPTGYDGDNEEDDKPVKRSRRH